MSIGSAITRNNSKINITSCTRIASQARNDGLKQVACKKHPPHRHCEAQRFVPKQSMLANKRHQSQLSHTIQRMSSGSAISQLMSSLFIHRELLTWELSHYRITPVWANIFEESEIIF